MRFDSIVIADAVQFTMAQKTTFLYLILGFVETLSCSFHSRLCSSGKPLRMNFFYLPSPLDRWMAPAVFVPVIFGFGVNPSLATYLKRPSHNAPLPLSLPPSRSSPPLQLGMTSSNARWHRRSKEEEEGGIPSEEVGIF